MKTPAAFLMLVGIFGTQEPASMGTAELEARVKERGRALSSILASDSVRPEEFKEAARALFEDARALAERARKDLSSSVEALSEWLRDRGEYLTADLREAPVVLF